MPPTIEFTFVPPYGTFDNLAGVVKDAEPGQFSVICCIKVRGGWWVKPYWDAARTPISKDGTFAVEIVTGGKDELATEILALLVPADHSPPHIAGDAELPGLLLSKAVATAAVERSRT